ncbi:hypothetical protein [Phaeobacter sp. HF9A]|uniref:hypothetical protein n=1 Tax=Phaeobacter sp. HF9A TaxID=2721561 RepID=UPI0014307806|nr:hypothetical protein [Phaeobacter sp. HF9A]NIZ15197.1 hypothetical protein [Phaeobacter sp. HF9A]
MSLPPRSTAITPSSSACGRWATILAVISLVMLAAMVVLGIAFGPSVQVTLQRLVLFIAPGVSLVALLLGLIDRSSASGRRGVILAVLGLVISTLLLIYLTPTEVTMTPV